MIKLYRICLCDDDLNFLEQLENNILKIAKKYKIDVQIDCFPNGETFVFSFKNNFNQYDLIILDIVMKNLNGIDTAKIIREEGFKGTIIFFTSCNNYALDSFEVKPLNYIIKSQADANAIENIFLDFIKNVKETSKYKIQISCGRNSYIFDTPSITYIESSGHNCIVNTVSGSETILSTLKNLLSLLPSSDFFRCHKGFIVNLNYIKNFNRSQCTLKSGEIIPIGRKYTNDFIEHFTSLKFNQYHN